MATRRDTRQLSFGEAAPRPPPPRAGPVLTVLPDAARVEEHLAQRASEGGLAAGNLACTFADLQEQVVRGSGAARDLARPAPPLARLLLYREVARERTPRGSIFFSIRGEAGFARALQSLAGVLGEGMLSPAALLLLCPSLPEATRARVEPLARLLVAAGGTLAEAGLGEPGEALLQACAALREGSPLPRLLREAAAVRFEHVLDWTPLRLELLFALAARLGRDRVPVRVVLPFWPDRDWLAGDALGPAIAQIEARGAEDAGARDSAAMRAPVELVFDQPGHGGPLGPFRERLFATAGSPAADAPVQLVSCASPAAQAREAAIRCASLIDAGAAPDSIAIAVRSLGGGMAEELGAALDRLPVAWRERRGRPALPSPPVQLALSIYQLAERRFPREELAGLLGSGLVWMQHEGERAPAAALRRRLREAGVRDDGLEGGAVEARLGELAARLRQRTGEEAANPRSRGGAGLLRDADEVDEVRARAARLIAQVRALPEAAALRSQAAALLRLLRAWGLPERLRRGPRGPRPGGDEPPGALERSLEAARARDLAAFEALERACTGLCEAAAALGRADAPVARSEWARLLSGALADASLRPGGARGAAVQLVELRELPGRSFDHLIVAGLLDGELPAKAAGDPLLADEDKRAINRAARRAVFRAGAEGDSPVLPQRQAEEPLLFALGLAAARRSIALLWPRADGQGRELLRSPFADEAARALGFEPGDGTARPAPPGACALLRARLSPVPALGDCGSAAELLARASLEAFSEPAFRLSPPGPAAAARELARAVAASPLAARFAPVVRAAQAERERVRAFVGAIPPGRFSGQLSGAALEAARPLFAFGPEAPISATLLDHDATCAFRTLGRTLLGLADDDEPGDELSPRDRGSLLHSCLEAFYSALGRELPTGAAGQLALLRETAALQLDRFERTAHVGHRGLWQIERGRLLRLLEEFLLADASEGTRPLHLEQRFGGAGAGAWEALLLPPPEGEAGGPPLHVRGAIDRVDAARDDAGGAGALLVLDYKSGGIAGLQKKSSSDRWLLPDHQLLIYAAAAQARFPGRPVDGALVSLKDARRGTTLVGRAAKAGIDLPGLLALEPSLRAELRLRSPPAPNLADSVWKRVRRMRAGTLPADPLDCEHCDLRPVCRVAALPVDEDSL